MSIKKVFSAQERPALAILVLALILRLVWLDVKPPHFDEGVNGLFIDRMATEGHYRYDPANYHGPLHFYALYFSQTLLGRNLWALRLPIVLLSVLAVGLTLSFGRFIGKNAARWAALAMAVSPAALFYGRYAIHETWLLVALLLMGLGVGGLWKTGSRRSLWLLLSGVTLAILTKETYVIHAGSFLLAIPTLLLVERLLPGGFQPWRPRRWSWRDLAGGIGVAALAIVAFYASFGLNPAGAKGLFETFAVWSETGQDGHGHAKAWHYWLNLMARYEWSALLGLAGGAALLRPGSHRFLRYLAIVGAGTLTAYSLIPYKTPWCILVLLWPFLLVFGHVADRLVQRWPRRGLGLAAVALLLVANLAASVRLNFFRFDDDREPYVYVQTYRELNRVTEPLRKLEKLDPTAPFMRGLILLSDYHPLPWILGDFTRVGYYRNDEDVSDPEAGFIFVAKKAAPAFERRLRDAYYREDFRLRSGQDPAVAYFSAERFAAVFPGRVPEVSSPSRAP